MKFLQWLFAGKELLELDRWRCLSADFQRWLVTHPDAELAVSNLRALSMGEDQVSACDGTARMVPPRFASEVRAELFRRAEKRLAARSKALAEARAASTGDLLRKGAALAELQGAIELMAEEGAYFSAEGSGEWRTFALIARDGRALSGTAADGTPRRFLTPANAASQAVRLKRMAAGAEALKRMAEVDR